MKYYVVVKGKKPGIYKSWAECQAQIEGFKGAIYKSYPSFEEAQKAYKQGLSELSSGIIKNSLSVDAACSGNPGLMEYQGVDTATGRKIFHQGPFEDGTNNIGEFLALVHGLAYLKKIGSDIPIYTDSKTAMAWIKNKKAKTTLEKNNRNAILFDLIARAEQWLNLNSYTTRIIKWDTERWGEIPADFGRK